MNHPTQHELAGFLYGDLPPNQQAEVAAHLGDCGACRQQLDEWQAVRHELVQWTAPEPATPPRPRRAAGSRWPLAQWAAAAMILIGAGFLGARLTAPQQPDTGAIRAGLARELRAELRAELEQFAADQAGRQAAFQAALVRTLGQLEARRLVDYASLRRDVETMAILAQDELQTTRQGLVRLMNFEP